MPRDGHPTIVTSFFLEATAAAAADVNLAGKQLRVGAFWTSL